MRLYEKYRPTTFSDVVGQDKAVSRLRRLAEGGNLGGRGYVAVLFEVDKDDRRWVSVETKRYKSRAEALTSLAKLARVRSRQEKEKE